MKKAVLLSALALIAAGGLGAGGGPRTKSVSSMSARRRMPATTPRWTQRAAKYVEEHMPGVTTTSFENAESGDLAEVERVMERLNRQRPQDHLRNQLWLSRLRIKVGRSILTWTILHAGGLKTSKNVGTYWADSDAGMLISQASLAAHSARAASSASQGGFQIPAIDAVGHAFTLGAQAVNRSATYRGLETALEAELAALADMVQSATPARYMPDVAVGPIGPDIL